MLFYRLPPGVVKIGRVRGNVFYLRQLKAAYQGNFQEVE
jgi:hypothetical protein